MKLKEIEKIKADLQRLFPESTDSEIINLILQSGLAEPPLSLTVGQIIEALRTRHMQVELDRPRARIQPDGTINIKDTTTFRTYETVWRRLEKQFGDLEISELTEDLARKFCTESMMKARKTYQNRAESRSQRGLSTKEEFGHRSYNLALDTLNKIISHAINKGALSKSPLEDIKRKPLGESVRHGLEPSQVFEILEVAKNGGNDPELDYLMLWTIIETACRSSGIRNLRLGDIDTERKLVKLIEKGGKVRSQPITEGLLTALVEFSKSRGSTSEADPVFRHLSKGIGQGRAISSRRFDTLWQRIGTVLPWVAEKGISNHWLRHTTLSWVERSGASGSVTSKYAGHGPVNVTANYSKGRLEEIARVHELLFG